MGKLSSVWTFHFTSLQFFVPMRRAMEQKLLKYVPCSTLNSDSSAPLHWTTQHACSVPSSSPERSLVGVWHREFPSVTRTHTHRITDKLLLAKSLFHIFLIYTQAAARTHTYLLLGLVERFWQLFICTHIQQVALHTRCFFWMPFLCFCMYTLTQATTGDDWAFWIFKIACKPTAWHRELNVAWQ